MLFKDEDAFQDAWRGHTLFLSQAMRDHIIAEEGKKVLESSAKIEESSSISTKE